MNYKFLSVMAMIILVTSSLVPVFAQVGGPANPNANVTTAYKLLSSNNQTITVMTDLSSYNQGDTIVMTGHVSSPDSSTAVTLRIFNSHSNLIAVSQLVPSLDGSFTKTILVTGPLWTDAGTYTIVAQYGKYTQTTMTFYINGGNGQSVITQAINGTYPLQSGNQIYNIPYIIKGASVTNMNIFTSTYTLEITTSPATADGSITTTIPRNLLDAKTPTQPNGNIDINNLPDTSFIVTVGGKAVTFSETKNQNVRIISIPFHAGDTKVDIVGTVVNAASDTLSPTPSPSKIPSWVRHIFIYYGQGDVSEDELLGAIKFLINQGIMKLS